MSSSEAWLAGSEAWLALRPARLALRPDWLGLRSAWALEGGMDGWTDGRKISPFYRTSSKKMERKTLFLGCMLARFGALMGPPMVRDGRSAYPL